MSGPRGPRPWHALDLPAAKNPRARAPGRLVRRFSRKGREGGDHSGFETEFA